MAIIYGPFTKNHSIPRFNFGGPFLDEKSDFYIASFEFLGLLPKLMIFQKNFRATIFKVL